MSITSEASRLTAICVKKLALHEGEKVLITSNTSGGRLETYIIYGACGSGIICMSGAAAHITKQGEEVIIMGFERCDKTLEQKIIR